MKCSAVGATVVVGWIALAANVAPVAAQGQPMRVAVLLDGPSEFPRAVLAQFRREIAAFFGADSAVAFPEALVADAGWTAAGARAALDRLFAAREVDAVLALGAIGSHELARRGPLPKPGIAALVIDARVQGLPVRDGASGVHNLSYLDVAYGTTRTLALFHDLVPFHAIAVLIHPGLLKAIPQLRGFGRERAESLGVSLTFVPVAASAAEALQAIPPDADAVYLTPLEQLPSAGLDSLISGIRVRRLPSFSYTGREEVERGALASYAPRDDILRRARRVAGILQRLRHGEDPAGFPVALASVSQLTLNMATARAIGFSPTWEALSEADLLHEEPPPAGPTWSLNAVAQEAARANLELLAAERDVASAREDVRQARGALLPQVQATATGTMIRVGTAASSLGRQAERQGEGEVGLSQTLVDDKAWADLAISRHGLAGRTADRRRAELDIVLDAVTAYLDVLRAKTLAAVERANIRTTRSNLELAELRQRTGAAGLADVYRWQAELAQDRRRVLDADAGVAVARLELNRLLNRPAEEPFQTADATVTDPTLLISDARLFDYFRTPAAFRVFRDFTVEEARAASPELQGLDAAIAAERRARTAAGRSIWLPTVTLTGSAGDIFSRAGAGSETPRLAGFELSRPPDATWALRLQASLPLLTGGRRSSLRSQAGLEVDRLTLERASADLAVATRVRATLQRAAASWAGIAQARAAATASAKNLELVTDGYARGTVSIITLLDAQEAAVTASEAAANAVYVFLADLMQVQRAIGQFDFFRSPEEREAYLHRLEAFYRAAGVAPAGP